MFDTEAGTRSGTELGLDYGALCDQLRCRTTESLQRAREEAVRAQRRWRMRELAITRVLDERGQVDDSLASVDGVSVWQVRETVATARSLEDLPSIAAAASEGRLSDDQLAQVVKVAEPGNAGDDRRWAAEAPDWSPRDLAQKARELRTPTWEEGQARRLARSVRCWERRDRGMTEGRFSLPDVDGVLFRTVLEQRVEEMRPAKGEPWEPWDRRAADALMEIVRYYADRRSDATSTAPGVHMIVEVPQHGPVTIAGIPLPDHAVESLRAQARIEPVLVGEAGEPIAVGTVISALSEKTKRVVRQRDGACRYPGCDRRIGLEVHHLWPRSWGGGDEIANLATVCALHHRELAPQGRLLLLGNPNHPAGLTLADRDRLAALAADRARAGPEAA